MSASWKSGAVTDLRIVSEKGAPCTLYSPWPNGTRVRDGAGRNVAVGKDAFGRPRFATQAGGTYIVTPSGGRRRAAHTSQEVFQDTLAR